MRVAEEHAARLVEQPEWVLSEVLLSPDLAPHILAQLPTTEHAVKVTCRAWRRGWKETLKKRERPRLVVFGGYDRDGEFVNSLERYDPSTNEWEERDHNHDGVYERIELFVTLTKVTHNRYHPHGLELLCLKVGSDGTAKTGAINLVPEVDRAGRPKVDFGVFKKETSKLRIAENGMETGDVVRWTSRRI